MLSIRNKVMADLYMLVRKEAIQFEPQDRIGIDLTTKRPDGSTVGYSVGGIMFHQDSNSLVFHLYDSDGFFIPPKQGPRFLDDLTVRQLVDVRSKVENYVEKAMYRAKHIEGISSCLDQLPENSLYFPGKAMPSVMVDLEMDGNISMEGFCSIFKAPQSGEIFLSGANEEKGPYNYPLNHLTDNGVSTVFSCMGLTLNQALKDDMKNDSSESVKEKTSRKVVSRKSQKNGMTI